MHHIDVEAQDCQATSFSTARFRMANLNNRLATPAEINLNLKTKGVRAHLPLILGEIVL
jgi:hypothetical protein